MEPMTPTTGRSIMATAQEVARWMQRKIYREKALAHSDAVEGITKHFGDDFIYINKLGNPAIREDVLDEFRELTRYSVVWESSMLRWRKRRPGDPPDAPQAD
jgi:hypothetical protein